MLSPIKISAYWQSSSDDLATLHMPLSSLLYHISTRLQCFSSDHALPLTVSTRLFLAGHRIISRPPHTHLYLPTFSTALLRRCLGYSFPHFLHFMMYLTAGVRQFVSDPRAMFDRPISSNVDVLFILYP